MIKRNETSRGRQHTFLLWFSPLFSGFVSFIGKSFLPESMHTVCVRKRKGWLGDSVSPVRMHLRCCLSVRSLLLSLCNSQFAAASFWLHITCHLQRKHLRWTMINCFTHVNKRWRPQRSAQVRATSFGIFKTRSRVLQLCPRVVEKAFCGCWQRTFSTYSSGQMHATNHSL